jgi:hypothetical protein
VQPVRARVPGVVAADRDALLRLSRRSSLNAALAPRAGIVLLAADGTPNVEIGR